MAVRIAISRCRVTARVNNRLPTLAQAIMRIIKTSAKNTAAASGRNPLTEGSGGLNCSGTTRVTTSSIDPLACKSPIR